MTHTDNAKSPALLILVAGAKGAIGTTVATAIPAMQQHAPLVVSSLTTAGKFPELGDIGRIQMAGWDTTPAALADLIPRYGIVPEKAWQDQLPFLSRMEIRPAPDAQAPLADQVETILRDMRAFMHTFPEAQPVFVNLLPAACDLCQADKTLAMEQLLKLSVAPPDLGYILAALQAGIPIVNFTPNTVELPAVCEAAEQRGIPLAGRDGKTGQTFLKVVLASALKARSLYVDGWYSLNILGNADGRNLMDPERACGKLQNKTRLLDDLLGYTVGERHGESSHKVHIEYYPPRGDAKEAWDVIDFTGIFGQAMSLRLNLQGRDSILAAPMVIDLARWAAALKRAGIGGPVAELGFYFKKPVGAAPPLTFQEQIAALEHLERRVAERLETKTR